MILSPKSFGEKENMPKSKHRNKKQNKPKPSKWKSDKELFKVPVIPRMTVDFPRPDSNSKMEFTRIFTFPPNVPESKIPRSLLGGQSIYRVTYFLAIPGVDIFYDKVDIGKLFKSGKSLLQMPPVDILIITATMKKLRKMFKYTFFTIRMGFYHIFN